MIILYSGKILISGKSNMKRVTFLSLVGVLLTLMGSVNPCSAEEADRGPNNNVLCIESEREALLNFKMELIDRSHRLFSWNAADELDCCKWAGVVCDNFTGNVHELRLGNTPPDASATYTSDAEQVAYERTKLSGYINPSLRHLNHLRVLDLSYNDFGGSSIPSFIGSLVSLQHLNLSQAGFGGFIPSQIGNLSNLHSLGLASYDDLTFKNNKLLWLLGLPLTRLELDGVDLSQVSNWLEVMNSFSSLLELRLSSCKLLESSSSLPRTLNFSSSLNILDISGNFFGPSLPTWIYTLHNLVSLNLGSNNFEGVIPIGLKNLTQLTYLYLDYNEFNSTIPDWFQNFTRLKFLSISWNKIKGPIPKSMSNLLHLRVIYLYSNSIGGSASEVFESLVGKCTSDSLDFRNFQELDLGNISISGPIPDCIGRLTSLRVLYLNENQLNGFIPESLWHLSRLESLFIGQNKLEGIVSEVQLNNLTNLKVLSASGNSLILNASRDWVPHFALHRLDMSGWKMGPQFPLWLQSQKELTSLDISNTGIPDSVPMWFWNMSANFQYFSLSGNKIYGQVPNIIRSNVPGSGFDLSSNQFHGPLPILSPNTFFADLSYNSFSGDIGHVICHRTEEQYRLVCLSLHNNILSGEIPDCWVDWPRLRYVWMHDNFFSGRIPSSMGYLSNLESLHLENNSLSGGLPLSLQKCSGLKTLDLSMNSFRGKLPTWIGKSLVNLRFLTIHSNGFEGQIPKELCHLTSLQVLVFAHNSFSGEIPTCFKNFTAMTFRQNSTSIYPDKLYGDGLEVVTKGMDVLYADTLGLVKNMDLSSNNLSGEIPIELMDLVALQGLNLSRNYFQGTIPKKLGDMSLLESLDLSWNHLCGEIPPSISNLTFLSHLNLSHNFLSGEIPSSTQLEGLDPSSFMGNNLCGPPLTRDCGTHSTAAAAPSAEKAPDNEDSNEIISVWFYLGMGWGFVVGFWCVMGPILFKKSWRLTYFRFLDHTWEKLSDM